MYLPKLIGFPKPVGTTYQWNEPTIIYIYCATTIASAFESNFEFLLF